MHQGHQPPIQWLSGFFSKGKAAGMLTTHPHLVMRLRMNGVTLLSCPTRLHGLDRYNFIIIIIIIIIIGNCLIYAIFCKSDACSIGNIHTCKYLVLGQTYPAS